MHHVPSSRSNPRSRSRRPIPTSNLRSAFKVRLQIPANIRIQVLHYRPEVPKFRLRGLSLSPSTPWILPKKSNIQIAMRSHWVTLASPLDAVFRAFRNHVPFDQIQVKRLLTRVLSDHPLLLKEGALARARGVEGTLAGDIHDSI